MLFVIALPFRRLPFPVDAISRVETPLRPFWETSKSRHDPEPAEAKGVSVTRLTDVFVVTTG